MRYGQSLANEEKLRPTLLGKLSSGYVGRSGLKLIFFLLTLINTLTYCNISKPLDLSQVDKNNPSDSNASLPLVDNIDAYSTEDPSLDISSLLAARKLTELTIPENEIPHFKYTDKIIWLKIDLKILSKLNQDIPFYVVLDYPIIDSFHVIRYAADKELSRIWLGDHHISQEQDFRKPYFKLDGSESHIWVRIQSSSSMQIPLHIYTEKAFNREVRQDSVEQSLYYGALIAIFAYNLILAFNAKFSMYRLYIGFLLCYGLFQAIISGFGSSVLWPAAPPLWHDKSLIFFISSAGLFSYLFAFSLLDLRRKYPSLFRVGLTILYIHLPHLLLLWFLSVKAGIFSIIALGFIWSFFLIGVAVYLSSKGDRLALIYLCSWLVLIVGTFGLILRLLNLVPSNFFTMYGQQIGSVIEFILLSFAMAYKVDQIDRESQSKLSNEISVQTAKLNRIQFLSQEIQNNANMTGIEENLKQTLLAEFNISYFIFYVLNEEQNLLYAYRASLSTEYDANILKELKGRPLDISHPRSSFGAIIRRKRAVYLPRLRNKPTEPAEDFTRSLLKLESMFLIPLKIDGSVFAILSLSDTALNPNNRKVIKELSKEQRSDLELLSQYFSSALYQALQKEKIEQAQLALERQTSKLNRIQYLSQQIQNTSNFTQMINNLSSVLRKDFRIPTYAFYTINSDNEQLELLTLEADYHIPANLVKSCYDQPLDLKDPRNIHAAVLNKKTPLFFPKFSISKISHGEQKIQAHLGMKSIYFLPLTMDGESFASLSLIDTQYQPEPRIKHLTKDERAELALFSKYVSSALYQAMQKEKIQTAEKIASRAKNEAAINQLAAHLAHEVNNPLNYIGSGKIIQKETFQEYHQLILELLTDEDEDTSRFRLKLNELHSRFSQGIEQSSKGQNVITKVIAELRAITGVDGVQYRSFDIAPILYEELVYSLLRNQITQDNLIVTVSGTEPPLQVSSNPYILARSIRTIISNCIHFARLHRGDKGELSIDCLLRENMILINISNNSFGIKNSKLDDLFNLEKSPAYGTEQIGLALIRELLHKVGSELIVADHGRESGRVVFQLQIPN